MNRRQFIAAAGTAGLAAVAGCLGVSGDEDSAPRLDPAEMATVLSEESQLDMHRPVPVQPTASFIQTGLERGDGFLDRVPEPIPAERVSERAVRDRIADHRERALERRNSADAESEPFHAIEPLTHYQRWARRTETAFQATQEDILADVESEREETQQAVGTALANVAYEGDDRSRTLLMTFRVERMLTAGQGRLRRNERLEGHEPLVVGRLASDAEYARTTTDAATHLLARYSDELTEPTSFTPVFDRTVMRSRNAVRNRVGASHVGRDPEDVVSATADRDDLSQLLSLAQRAVADGFEQIRDYENRRHLALAADSALGTERDVRALEVTVERMETEAFPEPTSAEPIRAEREAAIDAARKLDIDLTTPSLSADFVVRTLEQLVRVDDQLQRRIDDARERELEMDPGFPYREYAHLRAQIEALPDAIRAFEDLFQAAEG